MRGDQVACALLADARYAFHVVYGIAHQREHVDHLLRHDAELFLHAGRVVPRALVSWVEHADVVIDELKKILVAGHDGHWMALSRSPNRQRPNHIIGFKPAVREHRYAERLARRMHERNLLGQI